MHKCATALGVIGLLETPLYSENIIMAMQWTNMYWGCYNENGFRAKTLYNKTIKRD